MGYLTGPVNNLTDFQVEFNGLLLGPGTNYGLPPVWDILDLGPIRTMDVARVFGDGAWSGPDFQDAITPAMDVEVSAPDPVTFAAAAQAFVNAFGVYKTPAPLWVKLPNMPAIGIGAKSNKRVLPIDLSWGQLSTASVQWRCPDAVWQSIPRTVLLQPSGLQTAGMVFPLFSEADGSAGGTLDYGITSAGSNSATVTNAGNTDAYITALISGPCPGGFTLALNGHAVTYGAAVPAGQTVLLDYAAGTAVLSGGVDRTINLTADDFTAVAGTTTSTPTSGTVVFTAASGTALITIADRQR